MSINNILQEVFGLNYNQIFLLVCFIIICLFGIFCFIVSIFEIINIKNFLYQYWKKIIIILTLPFIIFPFIILYNGKIVSIDGWFGFIGGYFGLIGAVGAVWWQLNEEKEKRKKEEIEEKKTILNFIFNILSDIYNRIDMTKKTIFFNLNPVAIVRGNPPYFLLEEKKLDILLEKISFLKTLNLSSKIYSIHYDISTIEMVCKEYMVSLGELYHYFGKETETIKIEDFSFEYNIENILFRIDKIKYLNTEDKNLKIFNFYLEILKFINFIAEKYIKDSKYTISHQEYIKLKEYLDIGNNIGINIIDSNKRMNILNFITTFKMMLIQFEKILYGDSSIDYIKQNISDVLFFLKEEINKCEK